MRRTLCRGSAFTLLEMLVVIVIMAIMLSLVLKIGSSASREAAVEATAQEYARTLRLGVLRAKLDNELYTLAINTTTQEAESIAWGTDGPSGYTSEVPSDIGGASGLSLDPKEDILKTYTQTYFDMTGKNQWFALIRGISRNEFKYSPQARTDIIYKNGKDSSADATPSAGDTYRRDVLSWMGDLSATNPIPPTEIDPNRMTVGSIRKLRPGVRFWNIQTDFDESAGDDNYIPGFSRPTIGSNNRPSVKNDFRMGMKGYTPYRSLGMMGHDNEQARYYGTMMQYFMTPLGKIIRVPLAEENLIALERRENLGSGVFNNNNTGLSIPNEFRPGGSLSAGSSTYTRVHSSFTGFVDVDDLSIRRFVQVDQNTGRPTVSIKPRVTW